MRIIVTLFLLLALAGIARAFDYCSAGCVPAFSCARCDLRHKIDGRENCYDCTTEIPPGGGTVVACTVCHFTWNPDGGPATSARPNDCGPCVVMHVGGTP